MVRSNVSSAYNSSLYWGGEENRFLEVKTLELTTLPPPKHDAEVEQEQGEAKDEEVKKYEDEMNELISLGKNLDGSPPVPQAVRQARVCDWLEKAADPSEYDDEPSFPEHLWGPEDLKPSVWDAKETAATTRDILDSWDRRRRMFDKGKEMVKETAIDISLTITVHLWENKTGESSSASGTLPQPQ